MAPKYTLHYFNLRARGEISRWIFKYAGQEFEDKRYEFSEWPAQKPNAPDGTLPWLEVDGKKLSQSMAIARYLARTFKLAGQNAWEEAEVDALVDFGIDAAKDYGTWISAFLAKDTKKADEIKTKYFGEGLPKYLDGFQRKLAANKDGQGFFVGDKPTWGDFAIVILFDELKRLNADFLNAYPLLKAHSDRVHELKGIKEWIAARPETSV
ncbi:probable glutathione S-transferase 5 [Paramacrobiotus metropolitanus]|uniref:probable glutathione S-transferase 5 n=1 Tax=Paramacrobiotus metropolitanus TaxID=2943436 RepID=UPI002445F549|nr:probable glutathione S-transferase 5 [Paramacrobiotus metropolitanus]